MLLMVVQRARAIAQNVFFGEIEPGAGEAAFLCHHCLFLDVDLS